MQIVGTRLRSDIDDTSGRSPELGREVACENTEFSDGIQRDAYTHITGEFVRGIFVIVVFGGLGLWLIIHTIRNAEDAGMMAVKWVITLPLIALIVFAVFAAFCSTGSLEIVLLISFW